MKLTDDRRRLLEKLIYQGRTKASLNTVCSIIERIEPTSYGQRRLWFLEQLQQTEVPYTLHGLQHLQFRIEPKLLERAVNEVVCRHEALRTTFRIQHDEPVQYIASQVKIPLRVVDLRDRSVKERKTEALRQIGLTIAQRFDLEAGPLLRTELYQMADEEYLF